MKRFLTLFLILPAPAFAHAGGHPADFLTNLVHLVSQPDHLIMLTATAAVVSFLLWLRKAGKL